MGGGGTQPLIPALTQGGRGRWVSEIEASLVYGMSSRTTNAVQKNPPSKKPKRQNEEQSFLLGSDLF